MSASSDQLLIFIEPTVPGARKLLKDVLALGGCTTENIKLADCIIVDQFSDPGRKIIREWGDEKRVLEYTWIENSKVMKGQLITGDIDMWLAVDDGKPIPTGGDEDEYETRKTRFQRFPNISGKQKEDTDQHIKASSSAFESASYFSASSSSPMDWHPHRHPQNHFPLPVPPYLPYDRPYMSLYVDPCQGTPGGYPIFVNNMAGCIYPYQAYVGPPISLPSFENQYPRHRMVPSMLDSQDKKRRASSPPISAAPTGKKRMLDKIFAMSGVPLQFWIQVDVRLAPLRKVIIANGGEISTHLQRADFAILDPFSSEFQSLAAQLDTDKPRVVPPSFVTESVACLRLQDAKDYDLSIFKDQVIVKQEKKSNKTCGDPLIKRERSSRTHYRRQTEHNLSHFSTNKHGRQASMAKQERIRSPTPPDSAPVRSTTGWKYTNSEKAYAIRYLKHKKGEKMNLTQLSDRLNKKLPHHSSTSWKIYIRRNLRDHIEDESTDTSVSPSSTFEPDADSNRPRSELVREDVETAANFFACCEVPSEAADTSKRRYSRLNRYAQCRTAGSRQDFMRNSTNMKAVENRLEEIWSAY